MEAQNGDHLVALRDQIYETLRNAILEGRLKVGERLKQDELASRMNVSRMPVREALKLLQEDGLVTVKAHRGAWVNHFSMDNLIEVYLLRKILEQKAVELAVPYFKPEDISVLIALNREFEQAVFAQDYTEMIRINENFHFALYNKSGFSYLVKIIKDLWSNFPRYTFNLVPKQGDNSVQEHWNVINAISQGQVEKAGLSVRNHIENAQQALINQLQQP